MSWNSTIFAQKKELKAPVNPQVVARSYGVDTLSIGDRLAVHTNTVDWLLLMPNIGFEFDVRGVTWNRWTVGLSARGNWQTSHTYTPGTIYNIAEARLDAKQYWRSRQIGERGLQKHQHIWDRVFSIRRSRVKHPTTTYYRGLFASYMKYSLKFGPIGKQGTAITGGLTYGIIRPMYAFPNGQSLDLHFGISVGAMYTQYQEYTHDREGDCYPVTNKIDAHLVKHPVINDIHVGLIYRLGHHPVTSKYRYRDDVDYTYIMHKDSVRRAHENARVEKKLYNEWHHKISREFWHIYDSIAAIERKEYIAKRLQWETEQKAAKRAAKRAKKEAKKKRKLLKKANKLKAKGIPSDAIIKPEEEKGGEA